MIYTAIQNKTYKLYIEIKKKQNNLVPKNTKPCQYSLSASLKLNEKKINKNK